MPTPTILPMMAPTAREGMNSPHGTLMPKVNTVTTALRTLEIYEYFFLDFRTLEKLEKKFILNKLHLEFNESCIQEDLLPNYTN